MSQNINELGSYKQGRVLAALAQPEVAAEVQRNAAACGVFLFLQTQSAGALSVHQLTHT